MEVNGLMGVNGGKGCVVTIPLLLLFIVLVAGLLHKGQIQYNFSLS